MKFHLLFGFLLLFVNYSFSQNTQYDFKISEITTPAKAKVITDDVIRKAFYSTSNLKTVEVHFNDETDHFNVFSMKDVTEEQLKTILEQHQLTLTSFKIKN